MCPSIVVGVGFGGVCVKVLGVGVFKCLKLVDFLSFREWSQDISNDSMGLAREALQVAESIQFGIPLGDFLALYEQWGAFIEAFNEYFIVSLLWILQMEGEGVINRGRYRYVLHCSSSSGGTGNIFLCRKTNVQGSGSGCKCCDIRLLGQRRSSIPF
jgi:hypothetical protein